MTENPGKKKPRKGGKAPRANMRDHARAPVARDAKGHFLPGVSGNPEGRPRDERALRELARSYGPEAIEKLVKLMRSAEDLRVQLGAAEALLTRGYGRPSEAASGPLVAINVGPGAAATVTNAHEAAAIYRDLMQGSIDVQAISLAPPALPAPGEPVADPRVEPVDAGAERRQTFEELAK